MTGNANEIPNYSWKRSGLKISYRKHLYGLANMSKDKF